MRLTPRIIASIAIVTAPLAPLAVRAAETIADLSGLELSSGGLLPDFARDTTLYTSSVPYPTLSLTVDGTPISPAAAVRSRLNGAPSISGLPQSLSLRPGLNRVALRVTATGAPLVDHPLSAGATRNLALHPEGKILQWGVGAANTPAALPPATQTGVTAVFSGPAGEYYLKTDGALYTLSGATPPSDLTAGQAGVGQPRVVSADVGQFAAVALRADGTTRIWSLSYSGSPPANVVAVAAGYDYVLTLGADGRVTALGNNNVFGVLTVPFAAQSGVVAIAAHAQRILALKADGSLVQWGNVSTAQATIPATASDIVAIDLNDNSNFALTRSGAVVAWGNTSSTADNPPAEAAADIVAIKTGPRHTLAIKADGSVIAWGLNSSNQPALAPSGFDPLFTPPLRDYQVTVDRAIPSPALSALTTTGGVLSPAFAPDALSYAQSVPYSTATLDLSATPLAADTATVRLRLNGAPSRPPSPASLPLRVGVNQINLRVTAAGSPLADHPLAANSTRNLAVSSAGAVMHGPVSSSGGSLTALPAESQSGVVGVFSGSYGEYALKNDGTLVRLSGGAIPTEAQPLSASNAIVSLAVGGSHALLLRADGTTYAWGSNNTYGQTTIPADAQSGIVAVACGGNHSIALRSDGCVVAWGQNTSGQAFVPPGLKADIVAISAYGSTNYALRADGLVVSWGSALAVSPPPAARSGVVAIAAGENAAYALTKDGAVVAWNKSTGAALSPPAALNADVVAIAAGTNHLLALRTDGFVEVWGSSVGGGTPAPAAFPSALVDAPVRSYHLFVERLLPPASLSSLAPAPGSLTPTFAGEIASYALAAPTPYRGLALHGLPFANHPRLEIRSGADDFLPVVAGAPLDYSQYGGVALRPDGSVLAWGPQIASVPAAAQSEVVSVAAGYDHALALKTDGSVVAWGSNSYSQTSLPSELRATAIAAGDSFSLVLQPGGSPAVFGGATSPSVQSIPSDALDLVAIAAGSSHAMGLRRDGRVVVWGATGPLASVPAEAQSGVVAIAAGGAQCLALRADGSVVSWGTGAFGLNTVPSAASYGVVAISVGPVHAAALKADGSLITWGNSVASLPLGYFPDLVAVIAGGDFSNPIITALLRDGSLVQLYAPPPAAPAELSTGHFALPLNSLLPLAPGANTLELRATSRTGSETRTYSIDATRSSAPELALSVPPHPELFTDGTGPVGHGYAKVGGAPVVIQWILSNPGTAELVVSSGSFVGPQSSEFALGGLSFPLTLGPGEQMAFTTTVAPAATGLRSAALVFSANLPHGAPFTLALRAEGVTWANLLSGWRSGRFTSAELNDPALESTVWGDLADPDGDGLPNLLEYALNTAPKTPGLAPAAVLDASDPSAPVLKLNYTRVKRAVVAGLVYQAEWSDTLASDSWSTDGVIEEIIPVTGALATTVETVVASVPAGAPRRFLRLRVIAP